MTDKPTAVLYTRVSTEEQSRRGYSLDEQLHELRRYAEEQGYTVLEEVVDRGYSRSTLNRPGMDRVRELVAAGGVGTVLAWKRDRFGAAPWPGVLELEFAVQGTALRAMDDTGEGDDAEFMGGIKDLMARRELKDMVRRTRMGKAGKVRRGKLLGSGIPPYGFRWILEGERRVGYEVDPEAMDVVRRLFELVASGKPMYAAGKELEDAGFPSPKGGFWRVSVIRTLLKNDAYLPHTVAELRALGVADEVLTALAQANPDREYGVSYFGKRRVTGPARGPRTYRKLPRSEWTAVPIPSAGIPRELVVAAREAVRDNPAPAFGGGGRDHELNGGIAVCGSCGRNLSTHVTGDMTGSRYWYYVCPARFPRRGRADRPRCVNRTFHPADALEESVVSYVDGELLTDPEELSRHMDEAIARERARAGGTVAGDALAESLSRRIIECEEEKDRLTRLYTRGGLTDAEYDRHVGEISSRREAAEKGLAQSREAESRVGEMERSRRAILEMFGTGLMGGVLWFPPRLRKAVYRLLGLRVEVFPDRTLQVEGEFDANLMRLTPEVETWVAELRGIDARLAGRAAEDPPADARESVERIERELAALRRRFREQSATSG